MSQGGLGDQLNIPKLEPPNVSPRTVRIAFVLIFLVLGAMTSFYQVEPEEVGVILRFGAYVKETPPGLHFKVPFWIDRNINVPVQRQLNEEFGFKTEQPGVRSQYTSQTFSGESNMLTGDLNAAVVEWVVQYRIIDPKKFLFRVRNPQETFRDMSEAVMRKVVGDRTVNEVLTVGRQEVAAVVTEQLQVLCDQYETGIQVDLVVLQDVAPPEPVKPAFNEVNQAEQERSKLINEAQSEYNKVVPRASGEAEQAIRAADGYAIDRVNRASGEAARFNSLFAEYQKAPEVTRKRIYLETLGEIIPRSGRKIVVDDKIRGVLPLLNLDGQGRALPRPQGAGDGE